MELLIVEYLSVLVGGLIVTSSIVVVTYFIRRRVYAYLDKRVPMVTIEITPPARIDAGTPGTEQLFRVLHGMGKSRGSVFTSKRGSYFSVEIVGTREQGIRFHMRVPKIEAARYEAAITSHMPAIQFRRIEITAPDLSGRSHKVIQFGQRGHFGYPLYSPSSDNQMSYITGAMTRLKPGEYISVQMVIEPIVLKEADTLRVQLAHNEARVTTLQNGPSDGYISLLIRTISFGLLGVISMLMSGSKPHSDISMNAAKADIVAKRRPARTLSNLEQQLAASVDEKLSRPLFAVTLRTLVVSSRDDLAIRSQSIVHALQAYSDPQYQGIEVLPDIGRHIQASVYRRFLSGMPGRQAREKLILSDSEIAHLYNFSSTSDGIADGVVRSLSRTLPAPLSLKQGAPYEVVIGRNVHHGVTTDIGLTSAERQKHMYIIGGTGNGKTTLMEGAIIQDIRAGRGVAVLDPHGDMAERLLGFIPEHRIKDVIYFNPSDLAYPVGLNLLELPPDLSGDELLNARDFLTEAVISIMRKVFSDNDAGGHRIEYIMRIAVHTALYAKDPTLFTVYDLLTNIKFRRSVLRKIKDPKLLNFWKEEFNKSGVMQQIKMLSGVTAKIGRFQFSASAERILGQAKSTINFDEILNGKILICNLSKGLIGEDTSALFGVSILAKLQLAAYRRSQVAFDQRVPFYIYVDEFQNFATSSFVQLLSEARKYRVYMTMAEQSTSQQADQTMIGNILANVGTVICFKTGNPADEKLLLPLFSPNVSDGEIANLMPYTFYTKLSGTTSHNPVSGMTILHDGATNTMLVQDVIAASRNLYTVKQAIT